MWEYKRRCGAYKTRKVERREGQGGAKKSYLISLLAFRGGTGKRTNVWEEKRTEPSVRISGLVPRGERSVEVREDVDQGVGRVSSE